MAEAEVDFAGPDDEGQPVASNISGGMMVRKSCN